MCFFFKQIRQKLTHIISMCDISYVLLEFDSRNFEGQKYNPQKSSIFHTEVRLSSGENVDRPEISRFLGFWAEVKSFVL